MPQSAPPVCRRLFTHISRQRRARPLLRSGQASSAANGNQ